MTQVAFLTQQEILRAELHDLMKRQEMKRDELDKLRDTYCHQLCEENQQYKDKKLKVVFEHTNETRVGPRTEHKECIGFLVGFTFNRTWSDEIYPSIAKVKKDGTPSKIEFSSYEMLPWKDMQSIEIIE